MRKNLTFLGGDLRELSAVNTMIESGYKVKTFALPREKLVDPSVARATVSQAVDGAEALILPVKGIDEEGYLFAPFWDKDNNRVRITENTFRCLSPRCRIYVGIASRYLLDIAAVHGIQVVSLMDLDCIALPNAVPTAEGALAVAVEESPFTVRDCRIVVLGYGRVGKSVANLFRAIGAKVYLVSRDEGEMREALSNNFDIRGFSGLSRVIPRAEIIINTVPALVLTDDLLALVGENSIIIDLASKPGGVDFAAAERRQVRAFHCLSLPGKWAPLSAGKIIARGIMDLLEGDGE